MTVRRAKQFHLQRQRKWLDDMALVAINRCVQLKNPTIEQIMVVTASCFGISYNDITRGYEWSVEVTARHVAMAICCRFAGYSYRAVGRFLHLKHGAIFRPAKQYKAVIETTMLGLQIEPIPLRQEPRPDKPDPIVLHKLAQWSIDGQYAPVEDILPSLHTNKATKQLNRLVELGLAETDYQDNYTYYRISDAGCEHIAGLRELEVV